MQTFRLFSIFSLLIILSSYGVPSAEIMSTVNDQTDVQLTIYNVNLGLVKEQREIKLPTGTESLKFMDVASRIMPSTVYIKSMTNSQALNILEQNYEYDLLNPQKLMDKYVGKDVKLYYKNPYTEREEVVIATLLSNNNGPVFKIGDEITFGHPGRIIFPGVPENLIPKPTLVWLLKNTVNDRQKVEVSYLTEGLTWLCDYILTLDNKDEGADLKGWVTLKNTSGTAYRNAGLKLVAGDIHRLKEDFPNDLQERSMKLAAAPAPQFKEEAFFEYHIYTLERKTTIKDNQTKQISLVEAEHISVKKEFVFKGARRFFISRYADSISKQKVGIFINIFNKKENRLGMPLPKGTVRVYKKDSQGSLQFIGEDAIDHTPKDEKITIKVGEAFDVVGERKQTDWKKIAGDTYEAAYEISLKNHKKEDVSVRIIEPVPGDWSILDSSHKYEKTEAHTLEFNVRVPRDGEIKVHYKVRMRY